MTFSLSGKLFMVGLLMYMPFSLLAISKDSRKNARQAVRTYTTIADRYAPFVELYCQKEQAPYREQEFYAQQLMVTIHNAVVQDKLVLYGNLLSRAWRAVSSCSAQYPLVQFDQKYLEDALGHAQKQYNQLLEADFSSGQLRTLIQDLSKLREFLRQRPEYKLEEQSMVCDKLKTQLNRLKTEVSEQRERISKLETQVNLKERTFKNNY